MHVGSVLAPSRPLCQFQTRPLSRFPFEFSSGAITSNFVLSPCHFQGWFKSAFQDKVDGGSYQGLNGAVGGVTKRRWTVEGACGPNPGNTEVNASLGGIKVTSNHFPPHLYKITRPEVASRSLPSPTSNTTTPTDHPNHAVRHFAEKEEPQGSDTFTNVVQDLIDAGLLVLLTNQPKIHTTKSPNAKDEEETN
ncbi:hypothetical protein CR513_30821, partial [Mucuna pruriens]